MSTIVDASVVLAWHFADEATPVLENLRSRMQDEVIIVPEHWFAEVANGLLMGERRQRTTHAKTVLFAAWLLTLDTTSDDKCTRGALVTLLPLARQHRLTIYDAAYLDLAMRRGLPLATLDHDLAAAARTAGVPVVDL